MHADDDLWRRMSTFLPAQLAEHHKTGCQRTPEIPSNHQEPSAGGLRDVAQGEDAAWGMKRGTRRGDVKFARGSFAAVGLVQAASATMKT